VGSMRLNSTPHAV